MTPNKGLQRTRAAVSLQSLPGELPTAGRRRAPLSFRTLGRRTLGVGVATVTIWLSLAIPGLTLEEIGRIRVVAPRSLAGAHVFVDGSDFGRLTFQQRTGPERVSLVLDLPPDTEVDIKIEKRGLVPIRKRVRSPAFGVTRLTISAGDVRHASVA